jgi:adenosylcobinamide kinase/adenosylcobinamide-phosphate guanylyltransferase
MTSWLAEPVVTALLLDLALEDPPGRSLTTSATGEVLSRRGAIPPSQAARLVFLCNPNNPTGRAASPDEVRTLAGRTPGALMVIDEAYAECVAAARGQRQAHRGGPRRAGGVMNLILVTGGARAGKSTFAERLARQLGGDDVCFLATAEPLDEEMAERIAAHRAARPAAWLTVEAPRGVAEALSRQPPRRATVIDCLTLLVSNILLESSCEPTASACGALWPEVAREIDGVIGLASARPGAVIVVSNEVGLGVVPPTPLGRAYRDLLGRANQRLAAAATSVYLVVAGLALEIKAAALVLPPGDEP